MSAVLPLFLALAQHPAAGAPAGYQPRLEPASDEPSAIAKTFEKVSGIQIECFASEPRLAQPVSFWIAPDGAFYVAETFRHHAGVTDIRDHMDWLDDDLAARTVADRVAMYRKHLGEQFATYETEHDRVRILRDTDDDGRADWDRVFADGFSDAAVGIGAGLLERDGVVWFTCIPDLWRLEDRDRDGVAELREQVSTGWGVRVALLGHDMHGLCVGPDGRLYWSIGDRGYAVTSKGGVELANPFTGGVFRSNLDGTGLELFATGLRNPQELAFDDRGELWTGDNNSDGGDLARWVLVLQHGDTGWRQAYQWLGEPNLRGAWNDEELWKPHAPGRAAYVVPPIANVANGPSGLAYYPGTGLPQRYAGSFFLCNFSGAPEWSGVYEVRVKPKASAFEVEKVERFVWRPLATDCDFGFDGGLYVSDWVAGWNKTGKGRIWRFFEPESAANPLVAEVAALMKAGMRGRVGSELGRLLGHADRRVRLEAHLELGERARSASRGTLDERADAQRVLVQTALDGGAPVLARIHAIWGLGVSGLANPAFARLLADPIAEVRAQTARTIGDWNCRDLPAKALAPLLADADPRVRRMAATAIGNAPVEQASRVALEPISKLLADTGESDPWLRHAATTALERVAGPDGLHALAAHPNVDVRVAAVVGLRRAEDARIARFLADAEPRVRHEAARAIYDVPIEEAFAALADLLPHSGREPNAQGRRALHAAYRLGGEPRARAIASLAADPDARAHLRREALELLGRWRDPSGRDGFDGEFRRHAPRSAAFLPELVLELGRQGLLAAEAPIARAFVTLAERTQVRELAPELTALACDGARDPRLRSDALHALGTLRPADLLETLRSVLFDPASEVRAMSVQVFQDVAPGEAVPLLERALAASVAERRVAYAGLARLKDERADALLAREIAKLDAGLVPAECALDLVIAAERRDVPALRELLVQRAQRRETDPQLAKYADSTYGGDELRGREIFRGKGELECLRCHMVAGEGGVVGPALDRVGLERTRFEILESICDPNRVFSPGYQGTIVFPFDGEPVEGLVIEDTPERVVLRKADGVQVDFPRAEIEGLKPGLSAMPANLVDHLSREEMRDLIEYLANLRGAPLTPAPAPPEKRP
ncbi:MAG: HEAT repeat domain-containing protein [Planctomycetes bacterium]|nr:HEAT repeat domain-containing protein [Planctomycetota bacterium]